MRLNCDLGESYGRWQLDSEQRAMPLVDQANIACGFHAGDPLSIVQTLKLAKQYDVEVGAHPSYPDLAGFGRRSMTLDSDELIAVIQYQIAALDGLAQSQGINITYVKPHGALYNDMMKNRDILRTVMQAVADYHKPLKLMLQAGSDNSDINALAQHHRLTCYFEAFADRRYTEQGFLTPRGQAGAVLNAEQTLEQVTLLNQTGEVITDSGKRLKLSADTLCVHGDNPHAIAQLAQIKQLVSK
ncbi:5-oxoprolinase subunit PxpA [Neptunicella marina]|uniref:5-oxoprolinase subunit PxpA n=1 Tax=Neptunicella marina TaxID=2125989 RepID=A0A8J6M2I2_9ALTE|nr:5-oxoprolinase subunit PxpA [Neptunicella marina]MBC3764391.1 5-oxoprolinase subunit PxpA [Neptunicella marina]